MSVYINVYTGEKLKKGEEKIMDNELINTLEAYTLKKTLRQHVIIMLGSMKSEAYEKYGKLAFKNVYHQYYVKFNTNRYDLIKKSQYEEALEFCRTCKIDNVDLINKINKLNNS